MSWLDKVKDHVGSGITSGSNLASTVSSGGTYAPPLLSQAAKDSLEKAELARAINMQNAIMNSPSIYPTTRMYSLREKILMRLDMPEGYHVGFDYLDAVRLDDDKMVVFVVAHSKHCSLEDDAHLFPSDTLITQLRLLRK